MEVEVRDGNITHALNVLKRKLERDGILKELKIKSFGLSKGMRKKEKARFALRRLKRKLRRERD